MTRKPKISDKPDTQGAKDSLEGTPPEEAKAPITADPQQAAAPAEADGTIPSATPSDAESGAGGGDVALPEEAEAPITADPDAEGKASIPEATITVTCHSEAGRRRAGRRWEFGDNPVPLDSLTDYQLAQLRGDPLFTVKG